uniref:NAD-binding protein n=1 Tax=Cyanothece sp. BG0011 TaxID=2082950 RepID=UPI001E4C1601
MRGLGSDVIQIIRRDKILNGFDEDIRTTIQESMEHHGIQILKNTTITSIEKTSQGLKVALTGDKNNEMILADTIGLAATGRKPSLDNLGLENAGLKLKM